MFLHSFIKGFGLFKIIVFRFVALVTKKSSVKRPPPSLLRAKMKVRYKNIAEP